MSDIELSLTPEPTEATVEDLKESSVVVESAISSESSPHGHLDASTATDNALASSDHEAYKEGGVPLEATIEDSKESSFVVEASFSFESSRETCSDAPSTSDTALTNSVNEADMEANALLLTEIEELELLIEVQQKKLDRLKRLRQSPGLGRLFSSSIKLSSPGSSLRDKDRKAEPKTAHTATREQQQQQQHTQSLEDTTQSFLKSQLVIDTDFDVLDARIFFIRNVKRKRTGPVAFEFVSAIDTDGNLHIFDSSKSEVLMLPLQLSAPLTAVTMDSADAKFATLVITTSDGIIKVIKINVSYESPKNSEITVIGSIYSTFSLPDTPPPRIPKYNEATADKQALEASRSTAARPAYATSALIAYKGGNSPYAVLIGDSNGMLHQYNLEGHRSLRTQVFPTNAIVSLSKTGNFIAVAGGNEISLVNLQGLRKLKNRCSAPIEISSVSMEDGASWSISAQLVDGSVVVFNTAKKPSKEEASTCDMQTIYRAPLPVDNVFSMHSSNNNERLVFARGYLWSVQQCELTVYNTSASSRLSTEVSFLGSRGFDGDGCSSSATPKSVCNNFANCSSIFPATDMNINDVPFEKRGSFACCACHNDGIFQNSQEGGISQQCMQSVEGISFTSTPQFQQSNKKPQMTGLFGVISAILPQGAPPAVLNPHLTVFYRNQVDSANDRVVSSIVVLKSSLEYLPQYNQMSYYYDIGRLLLAAAIGIGMIFWRRMGKSNSKPRGSLRGNRAGDGSDGGFNLKENRYNGVPATEHFRQSSSVQKRKSGYESNSD